MTPPRTNKKYTAYNESLNKQKLADIRRLDSIIAAKIQEDDLDDFAMEGDNPADEIYEGAWSTEGVNANRVDYAKVPDSVYIDCSGYVAPIESYITSEFGPRWRRYHYGIDLKVTIGDPVGSAFTGKVRVCRYDRGGYGSYVVVRHSNGLETLYGHLSEIKVIEGQEVRAGQCIGLGGNTGRSTGPHLHFETRFLGNPINPKKFFNFDTGKPLVANYLFTKEQAFDYRSSASAAKYKKGKGKKSSKGSGRYHKVRSGETLSGIAARYGTTVSKLCKVNGISRNAKLRPGQRLRRG